MLSEQRARGERIDAPIQITSVTPRIVQREAPSTTVAKRNTINFRVSSPFGMRVHPLTGAYRMHNGIDVAMPVGTPLYAPEDGLVVATGYSRSTGKFIKLKHAGDGRFTVLMHL